MKKLIPALLACMLLLSACAAPQSAGVPAPSTSAAASAAPSAVPSNLPDSVQVGKDLEAMHPILDSLLRAMGVLGGSAYAPEDPEFIWNVLYLVGVNWSGAHPLVREEQSEAIVPREAMQEFASAAFGKTELPDVPEDLRHAVKGGENGEEYRLALSDVGDSETRLDEYTVTERAVEAVLGLYDADGERVGGIRFVLEPNAQADSRYPYSVVSAEQEQ